jgi:hypothetical protein
MKILNYDDYICKLGENAKENWELLDNSSENNIFLHLSSFSSGYVIIEYNTNLTIDMLYTGALLCKNHTKYKYITNIKVDYCRCSNLVKGYKVGEVIFKSKRQVKQIKI